MSVELSTLANARNLTASVFDGVSRADVVEALRRWFDEWENRPHILDFEVIGDAGDLLGEAGYEDLDGDAWQWSLAKESPLRTEIAADFLMGYWRSSRTVNGEIVDSLLCSLDSLQMESDAYACALLALYKLAGVSEPRLPEETREELRTTLLRHLDQLEANGLHSGVSGTLKHLRGE